jgi:hypothetical protein
MKKKKVEDTQMKKKAVVHKNKHVDVGDCSLKKEGCSCC